MRNLVYVYVFCTYLVIKFEKLCVFLSILTFAFSLTIHFFPLLFSPACHLGKA